MTKARDLASGNPAPSTVSTTELGYLDGVTSAIQTQVDSKLGTSTAASTYQTKAANGLVLLNTTSFSGVSSQSVNSVFSATYDNYLIMINYDSISGADSNFWIKLRASGTDSSTTYANWIMGVTSANAANNIVNNSATFAIINQSDSTETGPKNTSLFLFSPFKAQHSFGHLQSTGISQSGQYIALAGSIAHLTATSYDGFTLSRDSGTFTGSVSIYGVNK